MAICEDGGADFTFDAIGVPLAAEQSIHALKPAGAGSFGPSILESVLMDPRAARGIYLPSGFRRSGSSACG